MDLFAFILVVVVAPSITMGCGSVKLIELAYSLNEETPWLPGLEPFQTTLISNDSNQTPFWYHIETFTMYPHVGTHMDAPCHVGLGPMWCIDEIPASHLIAPAVVIDMREKANANRDAVMEVEDVRDFEKKHGPIPPGSIVFAWTGWSRYWSNRERYFGRTTPEIGSWHFPGISVEVAKWLLKNRVIYGMGIDTASMDPGNSVDVPVHQTLFRSNVYGLENVRNLHKLPPVGATVYALPLKITRGSGSPVRLLASVPTRRKGPYGNLIGC